jgi:hypothetical protein
VRPGGRGDVADVAVGAGIAETLSIRVATDLVEVRPRYASGTRFVRDATISSSGARAAFEFRGEIVTVLAWRLLPPRDRTSRD